MEKVIAIRRENKSIWERRAPLTPTNVSSILKTYPNLKILVQPSSIRIFPDKAYQEAGAVIQEDISEAKIIFGVKEIPVQYLEKDKTYIYFSHTIKA